MIGLNESTHASGHACVQVRVPGTYQPKSGFQFSCCHVRFNETKLNSVVSGKTIELIQTGFCVAKCCGRFGIFYGPNQFTMLPGQRDVRVFFSLHFSYSFKDQGFFGVLLHVPYSSGLS